MSEPPITVSPEVRVTKAARLMMEKKIGCLPVVEGETLVGLVTETDLLRLIAG
jgi:acetoin utilization protein AcuB